jgi:formylglycine-generating enzyme
MEDCSAPPYSWNIVPEKEAISIETDTTFGKTVLQLRRRENTDYQLPDMRASVRATIAEGGVPTFCYANPTRPSEYLLLIERYAMDDHRAGLFDYFYQTLREQEVLMERFFYQGDLRSCSNERFPTGLSLQQLRYRFPDAHLVVMGAGYRFISAKTGELAAWTAPLRSWRRRVLLTPISRLEWGQRERTLEGLFTLLPASFQSLNYLSDAPNEALQGQYDALPDYIRRIAEVTPIEIGEKVIRALNKHFDPGTVCWIAACAVYPALHFELTLRLGRLISTSLGYNLLKTSNILALTRFPWFTSGQMPVEVRNQLIEFLSRNHPDQHLLVLDYLTQLMENNPPPEKSVAWATHQINLTLLQTARDPIPDADKLEQLRAVVKYLDRPEKLGDFVLPKHWREMLLKIGFEPEVELSEVVENNPNEVDFDANSQSNVSVLPNLEVAPSVDIAPETSEEWDGKLKIGLLYAEHYILEALLGSSAFGEVWKAKDIKTDGFVALKIYMDIDRYGYFKDEFDATNRLEHLNIIRLFGCGIWEKTSYQVMPFYKNGTPEHKAGRMQEDEIWKIIFDIGSALDYLKQNNVLHNDIHYRNFLQNDEGNYLLTDFGLSNELLEKSNDLNLNVTNFAPEVFGGEPKTSANDMWVFGCNIYYLAMGVWPFDGGRGYYQKKQGIDVLELLPTQYSNTLNNLISKCLELNPDDRPIPKELVFEAKKYLGLSESSRKIEPLKTFVIYSHKDKEYLDRFLPHLKSLEHSNKISVWHDGDIELGAKWDEAIKKALYESDIVLVLVSADLIASRYVNQVELPMIFDRMRSGSTRVIPIILRPCSWEYVSSIKQFQVLPKNGKPISEFEYEDSAWGEVVESIGKMVDGMLREREINENEEKALKVESANIKDLVDSLLENGDINNAINQMQIWAIQLENTRLIKDLVDIHHRYENLLRDETLNLGSKEVRDLEYAKLNFMLRHSFIELSNYYNKNTNSDFVKPKIHPDINSTLYANKQEDKLLVDGEEKPIFLSSGRLVIQLQGKEKKLLNLSDILKIETFMGGTTVTTLDNKYSNYQSLSSYMKILPNELFVQVNRFNILNLSQISSVKGNLITMVNNEKVTIGLTYNYVKEVIAGRLNGVEIQKNTQKITDVLKEEIGGFIQQLGKISFEMRPVRGSTFLMGSPDDDKEAFDREKPAHKVKVSDFFIGKFPVTQSMWKAVMNYENPANFKGDDLPIEFVSWEDITLKFLPALRKVTNLPFRLPTEAEWEYAAKGGIYHEDAYKYAGSDRLKEIGWYNENSRGQTKTVGLRQPNQLGIYDMSGNVWEWCEDDWHLDYKGDSPLDGSAWIDRPERDSSRVLRGGSWSHDAHHCGTTFRNSGSPDYRYRTIGFRLALSLQEDGTYSAFPVSKKG